MPISASATPSLTFSCTISPSIPKTQLTNDAQPDQSLKFSPDGKSLSFIRNRKELRVLNLESKQDQVAATGYLAGSYAWAPDNQWIAYVAADDRALRNVFVAPAAGGSPHQISFLANSNLSGLQWSPDGKFVIFETSQRTETPQLVRIDLVPKAPKFSEDRFDDLFKPEAPGRGGRGAAATSPAAPAAPATPVKVEFEFDQIRRRNDAHQHLGHDRGQSGDQPGRPLPVVLRQRGRAEQSVSVSAR